MPEQNKKLAGFEALYEVDRDKRQQQIKADDAQHPTPPDVVASESPQTPGSVPVRNKVSKSVSKSVSNITHQITGDVFEPTTFKADRRKVRELKRLALELEPTRKLQELFDEALADVLAKYGRSIE